MKKNPFILSIISFSLLIFLWAIITYIGNFSEQILPNPLLVLASGIELFNNGTLLKHVVASLYRVTMGFYLAVILGIPLGIVLGRMPFVGQLINPIIQFLRPISPLAWIPLAMLWFGIGDKPAIFLIFLSSFFPLVVATTMAVSRINPVYFHVAANFNFSQQEIIKKIIIPAILPEVLTALRLTIAIAWLVVVAAEMIAVQSGLGYLILDARNSLRMDIVMVGMIVIGMIGVFLDLIMLRLAKIDSIGWNKVS
ncbi:MAG: ABC transporter permease [Pseudomonadota bacterium]